jgi:hypothetical protein
MPGRPRLGRGGLNLLGLTAILLAIAVAASVAIPAWFNQPSVTLDNAARLLAQDLRELQNRAAYNFQSLEMHFDAGGDGYACFDQDGEPLRAPAGKGAYRRTYSRDAVFRGVRLSRVDAGAQGVVRFDPRGMLAEDARMELTYGGEVRVVHLERGAGLLRIDGLSEPWHELE